MNTDTTEQGETVLEDSAENDEQQDSSSEPPEDSGEEEPPEPMIVRFIAMGDGGEGNEAQATNSLAIESICNSKTDTQPGCDFVLYMGDNFYDEGVDSVTDPQFQTKFEAPYNNLSIPFMVALGNHDYGGCLFGSCGIGWDFDLSQYQVQYSALSDKWTMPSEYYTFINDHVQFFALDTNAIMWDPWLNTAGLQPNWIRNETAASTSQWKIAFGHHPYISNGRHGNAGAYEGLDFLENVADVPIGTAVKEFMDEYICGKMDVYLCGHDHNRQWLEPTCGTEFIVSGAAAKTTDLDDKGNPTKYEDDTTVGFIWIEINDNCLTGEFYDKTEQLNYTHSLCK